jgi:hypothetical protein
LASGLAGDEIAEHLGVGFRLEGVALLEQEFFDRAVVFDHAVVDQGQLAIARHVGVGVGVSDAAMGGPAGVADATGADQGKPGRLLDQRFDAPGLLGNGEGAIVEQGEPGRIVAPVLQALQTVDDDRGRLMTADVANDSTHAIGAV